MASLSPTQERADGPSPELRLVRAIIAQAVQDLLGSPFVTSSEDKKFVRRQALAWLTASSGANAWNRNHLCSLAGLDGEILRRRTIAILEGGDIPELFEDTRRNEGNLDAARALWAEQNADHADWLARRMADKEKVRLQIAAKARSAQRQEEAVAGAARQEAKVKLAAELLRKLEDGPKTVRELFFDMDGTLSDTAIAARLYRAQAAGLVTKVGKVWRLAAPQTAEALPDPVVEQPAA